MRFKLAAGTIGLLMMLTGAAAWSQDAGEPSQSTPQTVGKANPAPSESPTNQPAPDLHTPSPVTASGQMIGAPVAWQANLPEAATPAKVDINRFHAYLLWVIGFITLFVFVLLAIVVVRFRASVHPVPSKRTHNIPLEVAWTIVPVLILATFILPTFKLMYYMSKAKHPELTVKVTGHQWYWAYEYPDLGIEEYASNMVPENKIDPNKGQIRLLSVDDPLVLPVGTEVQFLVTGADVIHSWYVPSLGVNHSGIPGRANEAWARIDHEGVFYGQCSKICGINHAYMPIEVRAVSKETFKAWADAAKAGGVEKANAAILGLKTASSGDTLVAVASNRQ